MSNSLTDRAGLAGRAEDLLAAVLESAGLPICVIDPEGRIRFANPAAIAALGYDSVEELTGRDYHETIHSQHPDGTRCPAAQCALSLDRFIDYAKGFDGVWFATREEIARSWLEVHGSDQA